GSQTGNTAAAWAGRRGHQRRGRRTPRLKQRYGGERAGSRPPKQVPSQDTPPPQGRYGKSRGAAACLPFLGGGGLAQRVWGQRGNEAKGPTCSPQGRAGAAGGPRGAGCSREPAAAARGGTGRLEVDGQAQLSVEGQG